MEDSIDVGLIGFENKKYLFWSSCSKKELESFGEIINFSFKICITLHSLEQQKLLTVQLSFKALPANYLENNFHARP